jgi:hypothetical protein
MCGTISKHTRFFTLALAFWLGSYVCAHAQGTENYRYLKLYISGGYGHFFNNFTNVTNDEVVINKPAFSAKLVWQPEYRLRVGIESGYYGMYSTSRIETNGATERLSAEMDLVPVFMTFSMNVSKHFDLNFGSGWAAMLYRVGIKKNSKNAVTGGTFSMSNYTAGITYFIPVGSRLELSAEGRYMYLGKTDDYYVAFGVGVAYKFIKWDIR